MTATIFTARRIITMNGYRPLAQAVLVRDGRIVAVGTVEECQAWGEANVDDRFADKVLMPGMVEAHGHSAEGVFLDFPYVGYYDVPRPDGSIAKGVRSYDELLEVLRRNAHLHGTLFDLPHVAERAALVAAIVLSVLGP